MINDKVPLMINDKVPLMINDKVPLMINPFATGEAYMRQLFHCLQ